MSGSGICITAIWSTGYGRAMLISGLFANNCQLKRHKPAAVGDAICLPRIDVKPGKELCGHNESSLTNPNPSFPRPITMPGPRHGKQMMCHPLNQPWVLGLGCKPNHPGSWEESLCQTLSHNNYSVPAVVFFRATKKCSKSGAGGDKTTLWADLTCCQPGWRSSLLQPKHSSLISWPLTSISQEFKRLLK